MFICILLSIQLFSQNRIKKSTAKPKFILGALINYNYVVGNANGDVTGLKIIKDNNSGGETFISDNLGMQQGSGFAVTGKYAVNRKRNLYLTGELGFTMFYNTSAGGMNRTRWNIFNLSPGIEIRHKSTPKNYIFAGMQIQYSLIIGSWQSDITYPDGFESNVYYKFNPANRLGLSLCSGMEFKTGKKTNFTIGIKGVWANLVPKSNQTSIDAYRININDSGSSNGINLNNSKEIIFLQLFSGINFSLK